MRITCPHCQKSVVVADGSAGTPTPCPLCGNIFTPPALAGSALDLPPAAPPPTPAPPYQAPTSAPPSRPVAAATTTPPAVETSASSALQPCCRCVLRRDIVQWLAPGGLVLAFLLTFLPWITAAPGGFTVFTQSAWGAAFGSFSEALIGNEWAEKRAALLTKHSGWNFLMVLYLLGLFLTTALALGDRFVPKSVVIPDVVRPVWAQRRLVINIACLVLFLLLLMLGVMGFGMVRAADAAANESANPVVVAEGSVPTAKQIQTRELNVGVDFASYGLRRSWWFGIAVLAQLTAAIGIGLMYWLDTRGSKPEPWADFYC
jgi:hypothetical protein